MVSIYAVVIHDPENRGFEKVANDATRSLEMAGFEPLYQSNEIPVYQEYVADPDFELIVCYGGGRLESLSAFDETQSAPAIENEELVERVKLASKALQSVFELVDGTQMQCGLEDALDRWDEFEQQFVKPEQEGTS